jgi:hypothetical protein
LEDPVTPCIEHQGARDADGYGMKYVGRVISKSGKKRPAWKRAHRWAWEQAHGPIPAGLVVMHICDNPPCINIEHLQLGTVAENNADRSRKGRTARHAGWVGPRLIGEQHSQAKLNDAQVLEIRRRIAGGETGRALASEFGICPSMVTRIKLRRSWTHLVDQEAS